MDRIDDLSVAAIVVGRGRRKLDDGIVEALADSVAEIGLQNPISVRLSDGGVPHLISGLHRLEAFKRLGRNRIPAIIRDLSGERRELAEIDENLVRDDLSPSQRAAAISRRKELYEELHPETRQGAAPGAGRGRGSRSLDSRKVCDYPKTCWLCRRVPGCQRRCSRRDLRAAGPFARPDLFSLRCPW